MSNTVTVNKTTNVVEVQASGLQGATGSQGPTGSSAHVGSGPPSTSLGNVSDLYFDNSNYILYKKTGSSTWTSQGSYSQGGGGSSNSFNTIAVAGQNSVIADSNADTLTLTAGSNVTLTTDDANDAITFASTDTTANETITLSGDVSGSGTTSITATLGNSGVSAGSYGSGTLIPSITVDAKGRVTAVSTNSVQSTAGGTVTSVAVAGDSNSGISVTGSPVTSSGTITLDVTPATLRQKINVEDGADVTDATNVASAGAVMDSDFNQNGYLKRTGAGSYAVDNSTLLSDLSADTTPQLGGTLETNSNNILSAHNSTDVIADSTAHFTVTIVGSSPYYYSIDGTQQATLKLERNKSYVFNNASYGSHPLYFQTTDNSGSYDSSNVVSYQSGNTTQTVILRIPNDAPDTLYYRCSQHSGMGGSVSLRPNVQYTSAIPTGNNGLVPSAGSSGQFLAHNGAFATPAEATTSVSGYLSSGDKSKLDGIDTSADVTDATTVANAGAVMDGDFTSNGFMKRTGAGAYSVDPNTYITGNETITISGDITGSGTTSITATASSDIARVGDAISLAIAL
jgi:hypothetical protein